MRIRGASSASLHDVILGPRQDANWLGVCDSALYLLTESATVLAVVTHDAVRLPCAVVLPHRTSELPLTRIAQPSGYPTLTVGGGRIRWTGPAGDVTVECVRQWRPPAVPTGVPQPSALSHLRRAVGCVDVGLEPVRVAALAQAGPAAAQASAAAGLLGRGPGLTPSGDDVLAGFLIGVRAFGASAPGVERTVADTSSIATTALSAQLLHSAMQGECVEQLSDVVRGLLNASLSPATVLRLRAVGNSSGTALAHGLLVAAAFAPTHAAPTHAALTHAAPTHPTPHSLTGAASGARPLTGVLSPDWREVTHHSTQTAPVKRAGARARTRAGARAAVGAP